MRSVMRAAHNVRVAAILAVGAVALHQLRYLLAPSAESAQHAHGYMTELLAPIAVLILAAAIATLVRGTEGASPAHAPLGRRIALFGLALVAIHACQETLEGLMATEDAGGFIASSLTSGGWIALPLAFVVSIAAALLARALEVIERAIAVVHAAPRMRSRAPAVRGRALAARGPRLSSSPLAFGLARRPPPSPA
jgi:hypothetical protein